MVCLSIKTVTFGAIIAYFDCNIFSMRIEIVYKINAISNFPLCIFCLETHYLLIGTAQCTAFHVNAKLVSKITSEPF